jgi:hypothetical protein
VLSCFKFFKLDSFDFHILIIKNFIIHFKQLEHKIEMVEKNHKHEIGVEIAHHKETQRQLQKVGDDNRELKVKLEVRNLVNKIFNALIFNEYSLKKEKERALDLTNIYSRQFSNRDKEGPSVPLWKTSTQSLNNESPHDKRKEYEKKRKEQKQVKIEEFTLSFI